MEYEKKGGGLLGGNTTRKQFSTPSNESPSRLYSLLRISSYRVLVLCMAMNYSHTTFGSRCTSPSFDEMTNSSATIGYQRAEHDIDQCLLVYEPFL